MEAIMMENGKGGTTNVSQLSGREPSRISASISSARGTSNDVAWCISPYKAFMCSAMLEPSWYRNLTSF